MTLGELRAATAGMPDDVEVYVDSDDGAFRARVVGRVVAVDSRGVRRVVDDSVIRSNDRGCVAALVLG